MIDPSKNVGHRASDVSIWQHLVAGLLILGFVSAGWARLNDCDLFNPDSPRYVIYSQSIANSGQYRAIDTPGAPLYTWRPPGLPILLAPVLKFRPYDVVAAKVVVLMTAALLLGFVHLLAASRGNWYGPLMVTLVGSSPLLLSLSTEVLTEVPYAVGILAVLYWIGRWNTAEDGHAGRWFAGALVALAFTPIIRTIGISLVVAVGLWCFTSRRRLKLLPVVGIAVMGLVWLSWRSRMSPGSNYAGSILQTIREDGLPTVLLNAAKTLMYYASAFPGVLMPGWTREQPFYAPMVIGTLPTLGAPWNISATITSIVMFVSLIGMLKQRARGGMIAMLYVPLYIACLAIWPWRHERFLWPIVPLIWAFAPAGASVVASALPRWLQIGLKPIVVTGLVALVGWQSWSSAPLVMTNQRYLGDRDAFLRDEAPGFYFGGWRKAGEWVRKNTPDHARLLTWQAAVGGTAHRFQRRVQFETMSADKIRQQIAGFSSRYLVVNDSQFGLGFSWQTLSGDPAYTWNPVYREQNVTVLEVEPNRSGAVSRTVYAEWLVEQQASLDSMLARHPDRHDLLVRKADLLQEAGQRSEAIALLEGLVKRGMLTVRVCSTLGWMYFDDRQYAPAAHYLELARGLPNSESIAESLTDGAHLARDRLRGDVEQSPEKTAERSIRRIQGLVSNSHLARAEQEVDQLLEEAPESAAANYWRGYLHHLFGEISQAEERYVRAVALGSDEARGKLLLLRLSRALEEGNSTTVNADGATEPVDPSKFASHVRLAALLNEHGWSGRAVAVLEAAHVRFGDQPEILSKLADLYLRFARPEDALPLYRRAQEDWPYDKSLRKSMEMAEAAMRAPQF